MLLGKRTVSDPTTTPPAPTLTGIPLIIVPGPPLLKVAPSTLIAPFCPAVIAMPSMVATAGVGPCRGSVLVPSIREPEGFKDIGVLSTVIPGPPADSVAPPTENLVGFAMNVSLPTVKLDEGSRPARVDVVLPMRNTPDGPRLAVVLLNSTAGTLVSGPTKPPPLAVDS